MTSERLAEIRQYVEDAYMGDETAALVLKELIDAISEPFEGHYGIWSHALSRWVVDAHGVIFATPCHGHAMAQIRASTMGGCSPASIRRFTESGCPEGMRWPAPGP